MGGKSRSDKCTAIRVFAEAANLPLCRARPVQRRAGRAFQPLAGQSFGMIVTRAMFVILLEFPIGERANLPLTPLATPPFHAPRRRWSTFLHRLRSVDGDQHRLI